MINIPSQHKIENQIRSAQKLSTNQPQSQSQQVENKENQNCPQLQKLQVVAIFNTKNASGKKIRVSKIVKTAPANSTVIANCPFQKPTYHFLVEEKMQLLILDILVEVAAIGSEKKKQAIGDPNLVINLTQQQGQNVQVVMQPGFTSIKKEKIDTKNLGKYSNFFLMGIVR